MSLNESFTATITVDRTTDEVFAAVTDVRAWWSEGIIGNTAELNDEFVFSDQGIRLSRFRLTEVVPGKRVVWQVLDSHLVFVEDHDEWTGTRVIFDIDEDQDGTTLHFTHEGLEPAVECYELCSRGWDFYVNTSLPMLITTGTGQPIPKTEV